MPLASAPCHGSSSVPSSPPPSRCCLSFWRISVLGRSGSGSCLRFLFLYEECADSQSASTVSQDSASSCCMRSASYGGYASASGAFSVSGRSGSGLEACSLHVQLHGTQSRQHAWELACTTRMQLSSVSLITYGLAGCHRCPVRHRPTGSLAPAACSRCLLEAPALHPKRRSWAAVHPLLMLHLRMHHMLGVACCWEANELSNEAMHLLLKGPQRLAVAELAS